MILELITGYIVLMGALGFLLSVWALCLIWGNGE